MRIYHCPSLPGDIILPFRLKSQGLCNLLLPTLRAYINAKSRNDIYVPPCFRQLDFRSLLWQRQSRFYGSIANHRKLDDFYSLIQSKVTGNSVSEDDFLQYTNQNLSGSPLTVRYEGLRDYYHSLEDHQAHLHSFFRLITPQSVYNAAFEHRSSCDIAIHIRRGDFMSRDYRVHRGMNTALPLQWYVKAAYHAKSLINISNPRVCIFTDIDLDSQPFPRISGIQLETSKSTQPLFDILRISNAKVIVASRSSFSMMARQLGDSLCIWDANFDHSQFFKATNRDYFLSHE